MKDADIRRGLESPGAEYRPVPFWFWNGQLTEDEIERQLDEMACQHIGGIAISPRQGMDVPYLSKRYFELFRHAALYAHARGMFTWIYDEYPYPSGNGGGEVLMRCPSLRQTKLVHISRHSDGGRVELSLGDGVVMSIEAVPLDASGKPQWDGAVDLSREVGVAPTEMVFQECTGLTSYNAKRFFTYGPEMRLLAELPAGRWRIDACMQREIKDFKYYGGYIDPCSPAAAQAFIESTHQRYLDAMGDLFGTVITGVFTDETGLLGAPPWSAQLPEAYRQEWGEALEPQLCRLFDREAPHCMALRDRYYRTMHRLLRENYHRPISEWCRAHGLLYIAEVPGLRMTTQLYSDIVGGDFNHEKIGVPLDTVHDLHTTNYRHNPTAIASLARQKGAKRALVESFHSIGWSMTLQDAKWGIDYLTACGVNWFNLHAFSYSTAGLRKYDAPPSQFRENPYWAHYSLFADYAARSAFISASTDAQHEVAILEPTTSLWGKLTNPFDDYEYSGGDEHERAEHERIRSAWLAARRALFHAQIGFDHLDPELLCRADVRAGCIRMGRAAYRAVIVTESSVIEPEALAALRSFQMGGGTVLVYGHAPSYLTTGEAVPGDFPATQKLDELEALCAAVLAKQHQPLRLLLPEGCRRVCLSDLRLTDDGMPWLFAANQEGGVVDGTLALASAYTGVEQIFCDGREPLLLPADESGEIAIRLAPYEAAWFRAVSCSGTAAEKEAVLCLPLAGVHDFRLAGPNLLRLEHAEVCLAGTWRRMQLCPYGLLREKTGALEPGSWHTADGFGLPKKLCLSYPYTYELRMTFEADICPADLALMYEREAVLGDVEISLNGQRLTDCADEGMHRVYPLQHAARLGRNELAFRVTVYHDWEGVMDAVFLRGAFSLDDELRLISPIEKAAFTTACPPGAPFYSGVIDWELPFDVAAGAAYAALELEAGTPLVDCITARVNGRELGTRAFSPYRFPLEAGIIRPGENRLTLTIRNTLVHQYEGRYFDYAAHRLVPLTQ